MINLKTGAISVPGILSNLLYKDIAQGLNSYGGYSDDSMAGPQSPDAFSVTPDTYNDMYNSVGIDPDTARSVGAAVTKGLNSTLGVAALGPLAGLAEIANTAVDVNQGKTPENTTAVGKLAENLADAVTGKQSALNTAQTALSLASSVPSPVQGTVNAVSNLVGFGKKMGSFLNDLATPDIDDRGDTFGTGLGLGHGGYGEAGGVTGPGGSGMGEGNGGGSTSGLGSGLGTGGTGGGSNDAGAQAGGSPGHGSSGAQGTDSDSDSRGW